MKKPTFEQILIAKVVKELGIDRPVLRVDQVGEDQYQLVLLGGDVVDWPLKERSNVKPSALDGQRSERSNVSMPPKSSMKKKPGQVKP